MKKNYVKFIIFFILICGFLYSLNSIFRFKYEDGIYDMDIFYELPENSVDVLVLGSSHAFMDINPAVFWNEYGFSTYVLGGSVQPMWNTYYYLKEALKTQSPKVIILEGFRTAEQGDFLGDSNAIKNTYGLKLSKNKIEALQLSVPHDRLWEVGLSYIQYHNRYEDLEASDFLPYLGNENYYKYWKGYMNGFVTVAFDVPDVSKVLDSMPLTPKTEKYYRKIIELAQENQIPIIVAISPYYAITPEDQARFNQAGEIAAEYGVPFINFNNMYQELNLDFSRDCADVSHLNHYGGEKITSYLGKYIKENYDVPIHRGDVGYQSWDKNVEYYEQQKRNVMLKEILDMEKYLEFLSENDQFTYIISLDGEYHDWTKKVDITEILNRYGINDDYNSLFVRIHNTTAFQKPVLKDYCYFFDLMNDTVAVSGKMVNEVVIDSVIWNRQELPKNVVNGVNLFVFNEYTGSYVERVGFNAEDGYTILR